MRMGLVVAFGVVYTLESVIPFLSLAAEHIQGATEIVVVAPKSEAEAPRSSFLSITPDERARLEEERQRLSETAARFGTDPTAIIGYYQVMYAHSTSTNNQRLDTVTASVRLPVTPNVGLQVNMPYTWAALGQTGGFTPNGTSDMTYRIGGRVYANDKIALFIGADGSFPTASEPLLGTGNMPSDPEAPWRSLCQEYIRCSLW